MTARSIWRLFGVVVALRLLTAIPAYIDDDEAWFTASARAMPTPGSYFAAAPDNKPPGTVWFYWAVRALTGDPALPHAARALAATGLLLAALALGRLGVSPEQAENGGWDPRLALLFLLCLPAADPKLCSVTNEGLMLPWIVGALALVWRRRRQTWRWIAAGGAIGAATGIKQTGVFFLLPLLMAADGPGPIALTACGFLAAAGGGIALVGPHALWHWAVTYPSAILAPVREKLFDSTSDALKNLVQMALALLPVSLAVVPAGRLRSGDPAWQRRLLRAWWAAAGLAIAAGHGLFTHYFLLAIPPLCLSVRPHADRLLRGWRRAWLWIGYAFACGVAAVPVSGLFWGTDLAYFSRVAERMRELSPAGSPVFVWSGSPLPIALAALPTLPGFLNARFAAPPYASPETAHAFHEAFLRHPPALFVDLHARGDNRFDYPVAALPWLEIALWSDYRVLGDPSLPWAQFYVRKDATPVPAELQLCPGSPETGNRATAFPQALAALQRWLDHPPAAAGTVLADERRLRAAFAIETLDTVCAPGEPVWAQPLRSGDPSDDELVRAFREATGHAPFAVASRSWWASLAIVEMQPVAIPRTASPEHYFEN